MSEYFTVKLLGMIFVEYPCIPIGDLYEWDLDNSLDL